MSRLNSIAISNAHHLKPVKQHSLSGRGNVRDVAWSPDGKLIAVATSIGIWLYHAQTFAPQHLLTDDGSRYGAVAFSPDSKLLAAVKSVGSVFDQRCAVQLWDIETGRPIVILPALFGFTPPSFSPDGTLAASGVAWDGSEHLSSNLICLWDVETGLYRATLHYSNWSPYIAFSPDGRLLTGGGFTPTVMWWEVASGAELATLRGVHTLLVSCTAFSPDGQTFASGSRDGTVALWDVASHQAKTTFNHSGTVWDIAFTPDGTRLASAGGNFLGATAEANEIILWEVATGERRAILQGHTVGVTRVQFNPDGTVLASMSGMSDRTAGEQDVWLWDVATGNQRLLLHEGQYGENQINCIAFNRDGTIIASGGNGGMVRLWDTASGAQLAAVRGDGIGVKSIAFSRDGTLLASAGWDGAVRLWGIPAS